VDAEVEKQWAIVQEEATERKRLRAVTNASTATTEATKDLEKRLLVLESFVRKWEPELNKWKKMNPESKGNDSPKSSNEIDPQEVNLATSFHGDDNEDSKGDEEEQSSDGSEKSKSNESEAEDELEDDGKSSLNGKIRDIDLPHPTNVVEPEETPLPKISKSKSTSGQTASAKAKSKAATTAVIKSEPVSSKVAADVGKLPNEEKSRQTELMQGKGKQIIPIV